MLTSYGVLWAFTPEEKNGGKNYTMEIQQIIIEKKNHTAEGNGVYTSPIYKQS